MNLQRLSNRAIELHRRGNLPEADRLYLQILSAQPGNFAARHMLGLIRYQQGRNNESEALIVAALEINPGIAEAWSNYGLVLTSLRRFEDALLSFDKALELKPSYAEAFNNRGIVLWHLTRFGEALISYDRALAIKPDYAEALNNQGNALRDQQRLEDAFTSYDRSLAINPNLAEASNNRLRAEERLKYFEKALGRDCSGIGDFDDLDSDAFKNRAMVLRNRGQFNDALACFELVIAHRPNFAEVLNDRGEILHRMGRREEALESFNKALMVQPDHLTALLNRGDVFRDLERYAEALLSYDCGLHLKPDHIGARNSSGGILRNLKRFEEALTSFNKALAIKPDNITALINRGTALWDLKRFEEAEASFEKALVFEPGNVEALNNRGTALWSQKRFGEALASYDKALVITPSFVQALYNRGVTLAEITRFDEAIASYEKARALAPNHKNSLEGIAHAALHSCDWKRTAEIADVLQASIVDQEKALHPFILLGYSSDPSLQLQCAQNFIKRRIPICPPRLWNGKPYHHDKIRVAYLSADYRKHATAYLLAELIESHDRSQFEILGVSFGRDDRSDMRSRLVKGFDKFIDVQFVGDCEAAKLLHGLQVDIAVDLKGYTTDQRPEILSYRPAPVQVNYLGYPGTLGAHFIDYVIADEIVVPFDQQAFFTEKIVHLPNCYQVNDSKRVIALKTPSRQEAGLPEEGFVFCCFNDNYKITAAMFEIWMRLLGSVPGSVLWLITTSADACRNLRSEAAARGIDPARLIFAPKVELPEHLARHSLADLFLDTLPCNAHTTTSDALWAGLPVVTCLGECFAGRVAASLLYAIGLPELVTHGLKDYADLALRLARDPPLLRSFRGKLERHRLTHALFDTNRFRLNIEAAYTRMWEIAERGETAQSFSIK
jgi:protein O-GlcNAc transferase